MELEFYGTQARIPNPLNQLGTICEFNSVNVEQTR